ncbi:MAG TPA: zinc ribbon domain-containing protein [Pyrinomonadaceae bacterium]|nr:zinc ribbon domain-containing protein [Pyrinomonadaceae bacterium]
MFCPKCAAQNLDGAHFCRVCGANISLVPQALNGQMLQPSVPADEMTRAEKRALKRAPTLDNAFRNTFMGIAFLLVTLALSFSDMGRGWWFWMFIPAFSMMGTGIAQYIRFREHQRSLPGFVPAAQPIRAAAAAPVFPARGTGELLAPPPSVTEGTTRHLGVEAPTKVLNNEPSQ